MKKQNISISIMTPFFLLCLLVLSSCGGGGGGGSGGNSTVNVVNAPVEGNASVLKAAAGPNQNISSGSLVVLNGSNSTISKGKLITYTWNFGNVPPGSTATLSNKGIVNPTFIVDVPGKYEIVLVVNDGVLDSQADIVIITATLGNSMPVAHTGKGQNVSTRTEVTLTGSGSTDADLDPLSYQWRFVSVPSGSTVILVNPGSVSPTFTPDVDGAYIISLVVNDSLLDSQPDSVTVIASSGNSAPVADAGFDKNVDTGSVVSLDGRESNDANPLDQISYQWFLTSVPNGK